MEKHLEELNAIAKDHGYEIDTAFGGSSLNVSVIGRKENVTLIFKSNKFSLSTVGTKWNFEELIEFKDEFERELELVNQLNNIIK
ncbi:hypothetical protein [Virgibacillus sp. CBA3643]|uniref:hypothetical protein n=1 Tax=Virgibacillus sp. CBA3643 TaxID=2942278 RepID=UPI0035A2F216